MNNMEVLACIGFVVVMIAIVLVILLGTLTVMTLFFKLFDRIMCDWKIKHNEQK